MSGVIIEPADLELWQVDLSACGLALDQVELDTPRLSAKDIRKIEASVTKATGRERRAAYIALRLLIERQWGPAWRGLPFALTGTGKPVLEGLEGSFSLAHVDGFALIGLTRSGNIGVDLEPDRARAVTGERRQHIERAAIAIAGGKTLPEAPEARFLQAWVRLEAVAKADARGIGRLLTGLGIIGGPSAGDGSTALDGAGGGSTSAAMSPCAKSGFDGAYASAIAARFLVEDVCLGGPRLGAVALDLPRPVPAVRVLPHSKPDLIRLADRFPGASAS